MANRPKSIRKLLTGLLASGCAASFTFVGTAFAAADFNEMARAAALGDYQAAYSLGLSLQSQVGDAEFDRVFGEAAVNSGHPAEGVLALERYLARMPGSDRARLDLAKGFFELGDFVRARKEFEFVLRYNPPPAVRANVQRYLDAMQTRSFVGSRVSASGYFDFGRGHDSNANAGTFHTSIDLPSGPVTLVNGDAIAQAAEYWRVALGGQINRHVDASLVLHASASLETRQNEKAHRFDTDNLAANLGLSKATGASVYRVSAGGSQTLVAGSAYRLGRTVMAEWQNSLMSGASLTLVAQRTMQSYEGENAIRDAIIDTGGLAFQYPFNVLARPVLGVQYSASDERNINKSSDLSRHLTTGRVFASARLSDSLSSQLSWGLQDSEFRAPDIGFGTVREDRMETIDFGLRYQLNNQTEIRGDYQDSRNESNQMLYEFRRKTYELSARVKF